MITEECVYGTVTHNFCKYSENLYKESLFMTVCGGLLTEQYFPYSGVVRD